MTYENDQLDEYGNSLATLAILFGEKDKGGN